MSNDPCYTQTYAPCLPEELQGEWVWVPKKLATTMLGYPTPHQSPSANDIMYLPVSAGVAGSCAPAVPWTASPAPSPVNNALPGQLAESPVEPLLEGFDISAALQLQACLEQTEQPWAISPLDYAASIDLFADCMDADLFSGLDLGLRPENLPTPPDSPSFTSSPAAPAATPLLSCPEPSCPAVFNNQSSLRYAYPSLNSPSHRSILPTHSLSHHDLHDSANKASPTYPFNYKQH